MTEVVGAPEKEQHSASGRVLAILPLACGVLCTLGWVALMVGLFAGMDITESGVALTVALLVITVVTALSTVPLRSTGRIVAIIAAVLYAAVWTYFRYAFDTTMPDGLLYLLTAVFFLTPLVTGVTAIVVGVRARKR